MSTTQPIRNKQQLEEFKNYYLKDAPNYRNYVLIMVALYTALRISDILHLTLDTIYDSNFNVRTYLVIKERKTGKENRIFIKDKLQKILIRYQAELIETKMYQEGNPYLFPSPRSVGKPLSRSQAYRIMRSAAEAVGIEGKISCHSMRKTFGYHAWKQGKDPVVIMVLFNHSSLSITKRYLCIEQDDKDAIFRETDI